MACPERTPQQGMREGVNQIIIGKLNSGHGVEEAMQKLTEVLAQNPNLIGELARDQKV